ncbi:DedA family protein [Novosphingobium sp. MW5]|nr:DedA family protein [Novosphingobium sp. MW5]
MLRRLYDWTMAKASDPRAEWWLAAFSFMESSFFPIPPHPLLGLMCLAEPKKAMRFALITTISSVLGGLFGYAIGFFVFEALGAQILDVLGLTQSFPKAACYLREYGVEIILIKGATPIPFKLLTITAGFIAMPLIPFILASIASRGFQFLLVGGLFRLFGAPIKKFIDKYLALVSAAFVVLVVGGFIMAAMMSGAPGKTSAKCDNAPSISAAV